MSGVIPDMITYSALVLWMDLQVGACLPLPIGSLAWHIPLALLRHGWLALAGQLAWCGEDRVLAGLRRRAGQQLWYGSAGASTGWDEAFVHHRAPGHTDVAVWRRLRGRAGLQLLLRFVHLMYGWVPDSIVPPGAWISEVPHVLLYVLTILVMYGFVPDSMIPIGYWISVVPYVLFYILTILVDMWQKEGAKKEPRDGELPERLAIRSLVQTVISTWASTGWHVHNWYRHRCKGGARTGSLARAGVARTGSRGLCVL